MGYYVLEKSGDQFKFNLKSDNHETILTSERYVTKAGAQGGIASCQENSQFDARYDRLSARDGKPYFNLKAANGQVIGTSETYNSTASREAGIASCKVNGPTKTIVDRT